MHKCKKWRQSVNDCLFCMGFLRLLCVGAVFLSYDGSLSLPSLGTLRRFHKSLPSYAIRPLVSSCRITFSSSRRRRRCRTN